MAKKQQSATRAASTQARASTHHHATRAANSLTSAHTTTPTTTRARCARENRICLRSNLSTFKLIALAATVFFGASALILFLQIESANAQIATVGQTIDATAGALTLPCDLDTNIFEFQAVNINSPDPNFYSKYTNPRTPHSSLTACDGTGLTVQDTRYEGGFVLQVNATDYTSTTDPLDKIDITNLSFLTQQANTSYSEDSSGVSAFVGSGDTLLTGSQDDEVEIEYELPFDFNYYGTAYTTVYLCDNGIINFSDGDADPTYDTDSECSPSTDTVFEDPGPTPHILPYYKDLNLNFGINAAFGIYAVEPDASTVRFRWRGAPNDNWAELVEFEVILHNSEDEDYMTFNYADATRLTDATDVGHPDPGPLVGVTKGGAATPPVSATYTESYLSRSAAGTDLVDGQDIFRPGFDFTEVKKPGTPAAVASYNGDPSEDADFEYFTDGDDDGTSDAFNLIYGHVTPVGEFTPGRIGLYTVYPSLRLQIPSSTDDGTYTNEITFTISDSTGP